jgi:hypothetical protein
VSRSLKSVGANATLVAGDVEAFVRRLKVEVDGEIDVAGPELAGSLTDLGLIDEYRLYFRPFVLGRGKPYFAGARPPLRLRDSPDGLRGTSGPLWVIKVVPLAQRRSIRPKLTLPVRSNACQDSSLVSGKFERIAGFSWGAAPGSLLLEQFQGMTSITAARRNLLRCKVPRSTNPGSSCVRLGELCHF